MLRKSITALMGAAALVATLAPASANNTIRIYDGPNAMSHFGAGDLGRGMPSLRPTVTYGTINAPSYTAGNFGTWWRSGGAVGSIDASKYIANPGVVPYVSGGSIPFFRPIARPILVPIVQTVEVDSTPVVEIVETVDVVTAEPITVDVVEVVAPAEKLVLDCIVAGTPVESPDDIYISNPHDKATVADMEVLYKAADGSEGSVVLPVIEPGEGIYVSKAVEGGMEPGAVCSAVEA